MGRPKKEISIVDRRLQSGSIFGTSAKPIPLVEPKRWTLRIVNSKISNNHLYDMQAEKGWVYAHPEDLAVDPKEIGFQVLDGRVVRGTQGEEILMKMEVADYKAVQRAKDAANRKNTFGKKATKDAILAAASAEPGGDEGANILNRALARSAITDSRELTELE